MAKLVFLVVFAVMMAMATAASFGGVKDWAGNYYDYTTGQYSSALTGKVYNTAPVAPVAAVAPIAPYVYPSQIVSAPYYHGGYPYSYVY